MDNLNIRYNNNIYLFSVFVCMYIYGIYIIEKVHSKSTTQIILMNYTPNAYFAILII